MDTLQIHYPAVLLAALSAFLIGGLWYSPLLFARAWMKETGLSEAQTRGARLGRVFGLSALAHAVMAFNLAAFIGSQSSFGFAVFAGLATGLGWVAMSLGVIYLFEQRSFKLWLINSGNQVLSYTVMGAILGIWR